MIDDSDEEEEVRKEAVALPKPVPEDIQENDEDGEEELFGSHSSTKKGYSKRPVEKKEVEPGSRKRRAAAVSATKRLSEIKNDAYFKEQIASTHKTPRNQRKQEGSDDEEEDEDEDEEGSVEEVVQHESKKRKQPSKSSSSSSSSMPSRPSTGRSQRVASARDTERSRTLDKIRRRSDVQRQGLSALDALSSSDEEDQDYAEEDDDEGEEEQEQDGGGQQQEDEQEEEDEEEEEEEEEEEDEDVKHKGRRRKKSRLDDDDEDEDEEDEDDDEEEEEALDGPMLYWQVDAMREDAFERDEMEASSSLGASGKGCQHGGNMKM